MALLVLGRFSTSPLFFGPICIQEGRRRWVAGDVIRFLIYLYSLGARASVFALWCLLSSIALVRLVWLCLNLFYGGR